ncbi:hypothetical protein R69746_08188 [Paraburkholderia aspalathi]|nr:hypothetical protein R69746_08188 [Paraburkholderia aspalathi]
MNPQRGKRSGLAARHRHVAPHIIEFECLAENVGLAICRFDTKCRLRYINARMAALLNVDRNKAIDSRGTAALFPDGRFDAFDRALRQVIHDGRTVEIEMSVPIAGDAHHLHLIRIITVNDAAGDRTGVLAIGRDISEERRAEESLRVRQREFRSLVDNAPDNIVRYDKDCTVVFANRAALPQNVPAIPREGMRSQNFEWGQDLRDEKRRYTAALERVIATGVAETVEVRVPSTEPDQRTHEIKIVAERDERDHVLGALVFGRDITERKRMEALLRSREREMRSLAENVPDIIIRFDRDARRSYFNTAYLRATGSVAEELMGKTPGEIARLTDNGQACEAHVRKVLETGRELSMEQIFTTKDGHDRRFHGRYCPERDPAGQVTSVLFVARDMTEVYEYQAKIHSLAYFDTLTGLPNRLHFNERIASDLARAKLGRYPLSVLILDLDRFKTINDTLGHIAGDQLLCEVARRLAACVRETDCVARLGGDEFTIILPHVNSAAEIAQIANNILAVVSEPILIEGRELVTSMSIGVATYPADGSTESELIRSADAALYGAKSAGRNNVQFHTEKLTASNEARLNVEVDLRAGIAQDALEVHYQPKVELATGRVVRAEALVRWRHPRRGWISPVEFIGMAEETGLIVPLGEQVLRRSCQLARQWNALSANPVHVAVNLSPRQFYLIDVVASVGRALAEAECKPTWLQLEITESLLFVSNERMRSDLLKLEEMGILVAIDDFGTGYSALGYLTQFPISILKIDRSILSA